MKGRRTAFSFYSDFWILTPDSCFSSPKKDERTHLRF
jgi:hypothetical protein